MKRQLPFVLVFIFGAFMAVQYFIPHGSSEWVYEFFALDWVPIIGIFALALGIWSLIRVSVDKIKNRKPDWQYSIVLLAGLATIIFFGFFVKADGHWGFRFLSSEGLQSYMFRHLFDYIVIPAQATVFSLLAFYVASASYRAFRARNLLATLLLLSALILMLRFTPIPGIAEYLSKTATWLLNVPNLAAKRAIITGIGLGMVATALKVVLGIERGYMGKG
jgi:hypothetical protein